MHSENKNSTHDNNKTTNIINILSGFWPIKVSELVYTDDDLFYNQYTNNYLRYDPSLRRIKDDEIKCDKCDIPDDKRVIIPIKYHPIHMKYLYVCDNCGNIFKNEKKTS